MGVCGKEGGMSVQLKLTCYMYHSGSNYSLVWFPAWPGYEAMLNTHEKQKLASPSFKKFDVPVCGTLPQYEATSSVCFG